MPPSIFDDPRLFLQSRFKRQVQRLEHAERADLRQVVIGVLMDPQVGDRRPDGAYELAFGHHVLRYALLDDEDPQTRVTLIDLSVV